MWKMLARMVPPRTLRFKLMIASVVCILIPACITISVYNYLTRDAVKEQAVSNAAESLKLVDGYVTNLLKYMLNIANYIQIDSEINTILNEVSKAGYQGADIEYRRFADRYKITSKITNITFTGEKSYVTILLKNGTYYTNYPLYEYDPAQIFQEPWFGKLKELNGLQSYWVGTAPTVFAIEKSLKNTHQISVARTLRGDGLDIYGYVIVTVMENQVNQIFNRIASGQETLLLDESDTILSQRNSEHVGTQFPYVKQAAERASDIIRIENEDYLLTTLPLSVTDWKLVSLIPYKKAIFKIDSIFKRVLIYQVISFLVFLLLLLYLLQAFTKPLVHLGRVAATVRRGNLEVRSYIRGQDEIGNLGMSIDQMLDHIKYMIAEITETQTRKRKAELAMLQVQINPHFLFNVLNSIRMKVLRKGDVESAQMMSSLSKLLRMTISQDQDLIYLHEEVGTVKEYVQLMDMRQKEKVNLEIEVSPDVLFEKVPRFFLQPIIENALIHGLNQCAGTITLRATVNERQFVVVVEDNGQGMEPHVLASLRHNVLTGKGLDTSEGDDEYRFSSVGLPNVWERMKLTFGDAFEMKIDSERGKGSWVTMLFPRELEGRRDV